MPYCDPCLCTPACGESNLAACGCSSIRQAEVCCTGDAEEGRCKCDYLKEAYRKSLENNSTEFCALAQDTCREGSRNPWCGCNLYQQICAENSFKFTCVFAAASCCTYDLFVPIPTVCLGSTNIFFYFHFYARFGMLSKGMVESFLLRPKMSL